MNDAATQLTLELAGDRHVYLPGEPVVGTVSWDMPDRPREVRLSLYWLTHGRGTEDSQTVAQRVWDQPSMLHTDDFALTLPPGPLSYAGQLIAIEWKLELVSRKPDGFAEAGIIVSPGSEAVRWTDAEASHDAS